MPPPYESSRRRGVWNHWVPLAVTVTVATVGVAAWVWSQRKDSDQDDSDQDLDYENADYGDSQPPYGTTGEGVKSPAFGGSQQFLDSARRTVAAGVTAAGAAVGSALAAIREEDKTAYADHETWSEEAEARKARAAASSSQSRDVNKYRKKVAIVVSADSRLDNVDADSFHEHASILSHIPRQTDFSRIKLYVLIYAPSLKDTALDATGNHPPPSLSSSFSNIDHVQAQAPADEARSPLAGPPSPDRAYNAIYAQAQRLVEKDSLILTFTTPIGHAHMLRLIQPEIVYLQESLAGAEGSVVTALQTWLRHDVVLVVGAESGHGGLADSESESERPGKAAAEEGGKELWWHREDRVGRGRGVVVVDVARVQDDWARRVQGLE